MFIADAEELAATHYPGLSKPLSEINDDDRPQQLAWWLDEPKPERFSTPRHIGALRLYLDLTKRSKAPHPDGCFPSVFEFHGKTFRRPDKGFIKACFNSEPPLLSTRLIDGQLHFDLTDTAQTILRQAQ